MQGYELVTSDDKRLGHVVEVRGTFAIVEHGMLMKARHAVPLRFVTADDGAQIARATVSKELIESSPKLHGDDLAEDNICAYYGLAGGDDAPQTQGYGVVDSDDPGRSAAQQELRDGLEPADAQRARMRENMNSGATYGPPGRQIIPPNAHEVGGRDSG